MKKGFFLTAGSIGALILSSQAIGFTFGSSSEDTLTKIDEIEDVQVKACMLATKYHEGDPKIPLELSDYTKTWKGGRGKTVIVSVEYLRKTELGSSGIGTVSCRFDEADMADPKYHTPIRLLRFTVAGGGAPMDYVEELRDYIKLEMGPEKE